MGRLPEYQKIRRHIVVVLSDILFSDVLRAGILVIWCASFEQACQEIRVSVGRASE
ncbi:hypothetical protein KAS45_04070 [candidate division WOR-3 bacterium]|nr:hypothetical protein [candidate division WOR-3 bacterium]